MSVPANLPSPELDYGQFIMGCMKMTEPFHLNHWRMSAGNKSRLWLILSGQHIHDALKDEIIKMIPKNDDNAVRTTFYEPSEGAREFWENGIAQNMTAEQIIEGWRALISITKEATGDVAAAT